MCLSATAKVTISEVEEGEERSDFWRALGASSRRHRSKYHSLTAGPLPLTKFKDSLSTCEVLFVYNYGES